MRRPLSILIVALFAVGPLSVLLPGGTELQLPACCRRHGKHHCAMYATMAAAMAAPPPGTFWLIAPNRCPLYNAGHLAPVPVFALAHAPAAPGLVAALLIP
ncbi:MAG: hypothetical protein WCF17_03220, partial [Terracidiphilus sp.]